MSTPDSRFFDKVAYAFDFNECLSTYFDGLQISTFYKFIKFRIRDRHDLSCTFCDNCNYLHNVLLIQSSLLVGENFLIEFGLIVREVTGGISSGN